MSIKMSIENDNQNTSKLKTAFNSMKTKTLYICKTNQDKKKKKETHHVHDHLSTWLILMKQFQFIYNNKHDDSTHKSAHLCHDTTPEQCLTPIPSQHRGYGHF